MFTGKGVSSQDESAWGNREGVAVLALQTISAMATRSEIRLLFSLMKRHQSVQHVQKQCLEILWGFIFFLSEFGRLIYASMASHMSSQPV